MPKRLANYTAKRKKGQTPEPPGKVWRSGKKLLFTVQKHQASHLHCDFRLEYKGVLLSWAVPKGPSYDPGVKRLAVRVEDHPVSYAKFEGEIPAENYGAGTVVVWDFGTWEPQGDVEEMLKEGVLKFLLKGDLLKGLWALIQMHESENWLLIKERDGNEIEGDKAGIIVRHTGSVMANQPEQAQLQPESIRPQLATLTSTVPTAGDWIHEIKFDGYRILAWRIGEKAKLITRSGLDWTSRFPALAAQVEKNLPVGVAVDGEVVVFDSEGRSDFGRLQNWLKTGKGDLLVYVVFDLLVQDGASVMDLPLIERKRRLKGLLKKPLRFSDHVATGGEDLFQSACAQGLEGIISKRPDSHYVQSRSKTWLKRKCINREEFLVGGFSGGKGTRGELGAVLLGQFDSEGHFAYCGKVGSGFDERDLEDLSKTLRRLVVSETPFEANTKSVPSGATWVRPTVIVEIKYAERTSSGLIRQGVFLGTREDKSPDDIHPEMTMKPPKSSSVTITHPDKILFKEDGVTKAELASYYEMVADDMLPFIADRPLAVVRCPDGLEGECFFQKHISAGMPASLGHKVGNQKEEMILVGNREDLITLVQFGAIEIHPWGSKAASLEQPDTMVFDLDPGPGVSWDSVVQAALALHERLTALDLAAYAKTSGGKGFHIVVPIHAGDLSWSQFKAFAKSVVDDMDRLVPGVFVTNMSKSKRKGRIFLDYLRNGRGATSVAAFSVRARPHAPVSVPIEWATVPKVSAADTFTVRNCSEWLPDYDVKVWKKTISKAGRITAKTWAQMDMEPPA